jgi:PRC-barrel domain
MENRDETVSLISAGKVQGTNVYNTDGDTLGEVYDVMIDKVSGKVAYAIMSFVIMLLRSQLALRAVLGASPLAGVPSLPLSCGSPSLSSSLRGLLIKGRS